MLTNFQVKIMYAHTQAFAPIRPNFGAFIPAPPVLNQSNYATAVELYNSYREIALALVDVRSPDINYKVYSNKIQTSTIGYGIHEKLIKNGRSIIDLSVGELDFPWTAADAIPGTTIEYTDLVILANMESDPIIAGRLRRLLAFVQALPPYTKLYHYVGVNGVRAITIKDPYNKVKFNMVISA